MDIITVYGVEVDFDKICAKIDKMTHLTKKEREELKEELQNDKISENLYQLVMRVVREHERRLDLIHSKRQLKLLLIK